MKENTQGSSGKAFLLKVPTPVFVIPGVILFVVGMLLVILIWSPLNLWEFGTGLGANSILMMAGFLFALFLAGFVYAIHLILDWVERGYKNLLVLDQDMVQRFEPVLIKITNRFK